MADLTWKIELADGTEPIEDEGGAVVKDEGGATIYADGVLIYSNITADILNDQQVREHHGFGGIEPTDHVAGTGSLSFFMNNGASNSAATPGYYSPDHASVRAGFQLGAYVCLMIQDTDWYTEFVGRINKITPDAGSFMDRKTEVVVNDFMGEMAQRRINLLQVMTNVRGDEVLDAAVDSMSVQPISRSFATDFETFPYALHTDADEKSAVMNVAQNVCQSTLGFLYERANASGGGQLTYENRHTRDFRTSSVTLDNTMAELGAPFGSDQVKNIISVTTYPPTIDTVLTEIANIGQKFSLNPGETVVKTLRFKDASSGARLKGVINAVQPVAGTDYNAAFTDGGPTGEANNYVTVKAALGANSAEVTIVNNSATRSIYFAENFKLRGYGMYLYDKVESKEEDSASIWRYGEKTLAYSLPYGQSTEFAMGLARKLLADYKDAMSGADPVRFIANKSAALMTAAVRLDIHDRVTITEALTGVSADFFIASVERVIESGTLLTCSWMLEPCRTNASMGKWGDGAPDSGRWGDNSADSSQWVL
jgi:hypothetical protein